MMMNKMRAKCIDNTGYEVSLIVGNCYDAIYISDRLVRIRDESGEYYIYPTYRFVAMEE